jgi:hypothetical protein
LADVRVIGAVAVKVRPDVDGFRETTRKRILGELRNFEADIDIHANIDERELDREIQGARKRLQKKMTLSWHTDYDSIDRAVKQVERKLKDLSAMTLDVEVNKDDLGAAEDLLKDLRKGARVEMKVASDERGFKEVLGKIQALQREKLLKTVKFATDADSLNKMAGEYTARLNELAKGRTVEIDIMPDQKGFRSAIDMIDKELAKFNTRKFSIEVDEQALKAERAKLEQMLTAEPYEMKVDWGNKQSLEAAKRELEQKLGEARAVQLLVDPDEHSIQRALDQINDAIRDAESNDVDLTTVAHTAASSAQLAYVSRARFADIIVRVNKRSLALAEGVLQSLAGLNTLRSVGRTLENLALNFDKIAIKAGGVSTVIAGLTNTLSYVATSLLSIGEGVFQSVGLLAMAPAMLAAVTASIVITAAAFEDFGAAVDGDNEALAKLPANAQAAANALRGTWEMIQQPVQNAFWEGMGESMADVVEVIMPQFRDGLAASAIHAGRFSAGVMDSFKKLAMSGDLTTMFDNLSGMFDKASGAAEPLFDAINRLGLRGSEYLPRFGQWLTDIATRFDNWVKVSDDSGAINRWIEEGIASLKDMWGVAGSTIDIFRALTRAANTAGMQGLGVFNDNLRDIADTMLGEPFQSRLSTIFRGANKGASELNVGVKALGRAFGESSEFVADMLTNLGTLGGGLLSGIARTFSQIRFQSGVADAIRGMNDAVRDLQPAFAGIGRILGEFGSVAGEVFRNIAPVISKVIDTLDRGMTRLGPALVAISGPLSEILGNLIAGLSGPLLTAVDVLAGAVETLADAPPIIQAVAAAMGGLIALKFGGFFSGVAAGLTKMTGSFTKSQPIMTTWQASLGRNIVMANQHLGSINTNRFGGQMTTLTTMAQKGVTGIGRAFGGLTSILGGPWGIALGVGVSALAAFGAAQSAAKAQVEGLTDSLDAQTGAVTADTLGQIADYFAKDSINYFEWADGAKEMGESAKLLGTDLAGLAGIVAGSQSEYDDYLALLRRFPVNFGENSDALKNWANEMGISEEAARSFGQGGARHVAINLENQRNALVESGVAFEEYGQIAAETEVKLSALGENMEVLADHTGDASDRVRALKDSLDILNGVVPNSEDALRKVNESMMDLDGLFIDAEGAVRNFSAAIDGTGKIDTSTAGGQALYDQVGKLSEEWLALASAMAAEGANPDAIAAKLSGLQSEFALAGEAAGLSAEQVEAAFQRYMNGTPEQIAMLLTLDDSLFNEKKELTEEGIKYLDSLEAIAALGGDDTQLRMALTTAYTNLETFDAAVATATANLDPAAADAVREQLIIDLVNLAATDPTIAADMDPRLFDAEIARVREEIAVLDASDASPLVDIATAEARQRLAEVQALQQSVNRDTHSTHTQTLRLNDQRPSTGRGLDGMQPVAANGALIDRNARPLVRGLGAKMQKFANGGIAETPGRAKIYSPAPNYRIFAEPQTGGESYIPLAANKRTRSLAIWRETGKLLGAQEFANGGVTGASGSASAELAAIRSAPGQVVQIGFNVDGRQLYSTIQQLDNQFGRK